MLKQILMSLGALVLVFTGSAANPITTDIFTADPADIVVGDTVYLR